MKRIVLEHTLMLFVSSITAMESTNVKTFLRKEVNKIHNAVNGIDPLITACYKDDIVTVDNLLANPGSNVNCIHVNGDSPLIISSRNGSALIVRKLLQNEKIDVDWSNLEGKTALMYACEKGYRSIVELLLTKNPSFDIEDNKGNTAYKLAQTAAIENPKNKDLHDILKKLQTSTMFNILTNPTIMLLFAAVSTTLMTKGAQYFIEKPLAYKDQLYSAFYKDALTESQRTQYETLLQETPNPLLLLNHESFINGEGLNNGLTFDQKLELLKVIRNYLQEKELLRDSSLNSPATSRLPFLRAARQKALQGFLEPYEHFLRNILSLLSLRRGSNTIDASDPFITPKLTFETDLDVTALGYSMKSNLYAAALERNILVIWDYTTGNCVELVHIPFFITQLIFNENGTYIAAVSPTARIVLISIDISNRVTCNVVALFTLNIVISITATTFSKNGNHLAVGTSSGEVFFFDTGQKEYRGSFKAHNKAIRQLFSDDAQRIFVAHQENLSLLDCVSYAETQLFQASLGSTFFSNGNRTAFFAIDGDLLYIYDRINQSTRKIKLDCPYSVGCCTNSDTIIVLASSNTIALWDIYHKKKLCEYDIIHPTSIDFDPGRKDILISSLENGKRVINILKLTLSEPFWLREFKELGDAICKTHDIPLTEWESFCTLAGDNPLDLLSESSFTEIVKITDKNHTITFQKILIKFSLHEHYIKPVTLLIGEEQRDSLTQESLLNLLLHLPSYFPNKQRIDQQLTENQRIEHAKIIELMRKDKELIHTFSESHAIPFLNK